MNNKIRVNMDNETVINDLAIELKKVIKKDTIIVCIGTDRCIGDIFGPLLGHMLKEKGIYEDVIGTISSPVHALNIRQAKQMLKEKYPNRHILAIDAAIGTCVNDYVIRRKGVLPGAGAGKDLGEIGDDSLIFVSTHSRYGINDCRFSRINKACEIAAESFKRALE